MKETETRLIHILPENKSHDQSIQKIAHNLFYVYADALITFVVDEMNRAGNLAAVGVVDEEMKIIGILIQRDISSLLSRPYGRDVLRKKTAGEQCVDAKRFDPHDNIFSVAEEIDAEMKAPGISYYLLADEQNRFHGIFSTKGMLIYLSHLTTQDIATARRLQMRIVKEREYIDTPNLEIITSSIPAKGVGGDFYAVHKYSETNWILCVCDVSGKGVAASVLTSVLWGMMSIYDYKKGLKTLVKELNDYIVQTFEGEKFVTAAFVDFNEITGKCTICDMGHSHLFVYRDGNLHKLKTNSTNLPIGIMPDVEVILNTLQMEEQDILFLITDGLIEQQGTDNSEYSIKRVESVFNQTREEALEKTHSTVLADFNQFRGNKHVHDDVTFVMLKYLIPDETAGLYQ
jgi:sigma-B regulation protein RsbU (phosphoserine phosphatase)